MRDYSWPYPRRSYIQERWFDLGNPGLVNPEMVAREGTRDLREACLSLPERSGVTTRSRSTLVRALGLDANRFRLRADGLLAQVLEHEIDHLDGVLYLARLVPAAWSPSSEDSSDPNRDTTGPR